MAELRAAAATVAFAGIDVDADTRLMVLLMSASLPAVTEFPVADDARGFRRPGSTRSRSVRVLRLVNGRPVSVIDRLE